jgi:hypothetical protein
MTTCHQCNAERWSLYNSCLRSGSLVGHGINGQDGRRQGSGDRGPVHLDLNRDLPLKRASNGLKIRNIVDLHV